MNFRCVLRGVVATLVVLFSLYIAAAPLHLTGKDQYGTYWYANADDGINFIGEGGCDINLTHCGNALTGKFVEKDDHNITIDWSGYGQRTIPISNLHKSQVKPK